VPLMIDRDHQVMDHAVSTAKGAEDDDADHRRASMDRSRFPLWLDRAPGDAIEVGVDEVSLVLGHP
jgi:hypothetical protein